MAFEPELSKIDNLKKICADLKLYKAKTGKWPSQSSKDAKEKRLGEWCHKARTQYKHGILSQEKIKLLEKIHFSFEPARDIWFKNLFLLKKQFEKESFPVYPDPLRGFANYHLKQFDRLPKWKKDALNEICFKEQFERHLNKDEETWKANFKALQVYFSTHGKLPSRKSNYALESWVSKQRQLLKKGMLNKVKIRKFEDAGIDLLKRSFKKIVHPWHERYAELKEYIEVYKDFPTSKGKFHSLYMWCLNQKRKYKKGELRKEKVKKLEALHINWEIKDSGFPRKRRTIAR